MNPKKLDLIHFARDKYFRILSGAYVSDRLVLKYWAIYYYIVSVQ